MADLSDVCNVLAGMAADVLYPNGIAQPSVADVTITTASGWPEPKQLDAVMAAGNAMLTVYPMEGTETNTTRFLPQMQVSSTIPAAQLSLTVSGNQLTVGGTIKAGEVATVFVNYRAVSYGVQASDTAATVAEALAALIAGAGVNGAVVTITNAFDIEAAVSVQVPMQQEVARQMRSFLISTWCPTPTLRDIIVPVVDLCYKSNLRIVMPDNTWARLIYHGTNESDYLAKQRIYRRDLRYDVEYASTTTETDNTVTSFTVSTMATGSGDTNTNTLDI